MPILGVQSFDVLRTSTGEWDEGVWTNGNEARFRITGTIVPFNPRQVQLLPEGERTQEQRTLYTRDELLTVEIHGPRRADHVLYDSRRWEVHSGQHYDAATGGNLAHKEYRLMAVACDEYAT